VWAVLVIGLLIVALFATAVLVLEDHAGKRLREARACPWSLGAPLCRHRPQNAV